MLFLSILRVSPRLPQCCPNCLAAGGSRAEGCVWGGGILPSGCGDSLAWGWPCKVWPESGHTAPQSAPERSTVEPQIQPRQDLHIVSIFLPPGFTQELWETVYMQRLSSVLENAHQKELHPICRGWGVLLCHCSTTRNHTVAGKEHMLLSCSSVFSSQSPAAGYLLSLLAPLSSYYWWSCVSYCPLCARVRVRPSLKRVAK